METFTVLPTRGAYRVMETAADGSRKVLASYPTEQAAMERLRALQEKAGVVPFAQEQHRTRGWRE